MEQNNTLLRALGANPESRISVVRQVPVSVSPQADAREAAVAAFAMADDEPEVNEAAADTTNDEVLQEEETEEFQMPDCIEPVPDGSYQSGTRLDIKLYNANCLSCVSLNPSGEKTFTKCHYTKGNPFCPAKDIKLAFVGEQAIFAERIKRAKANGNAEQVYTLLLALQDKDPAFRTVVLQKVGLVNLD
jgi:hypothetical protein